MSKLEFSGKIGEVSGFDADNDATIMLLLETLLAGYARIAVQPTNTSGNQRNIVMRPVDMGKYGRHFFLLPITDKNEVFRVTYKQEEKPEGVHKRTTIHALLTKHDFHKATRDTVIHSNGSKVPPNFPLSFDTPDSKWELYYLDVKEDWVDTTHKRARDYFLFMIRSTIKAETSWRFLPFFKRNAELATHDQAIVTYLRHLTAGNISNKDIVAKVFDSKKKRHVATDRVTKSRPIVPKEVIANTFSLPPQDGMPLMDWDILPSVSFTQDNGYILTQWAHTYSGLIVRYVSTIAQSLHIADRGDKLTAYIEYVETLRGKRVYKAVERESDKREIDPIRSGPDYELVLGDGDEELVYATIFFNKNSKQHLPSIGIRHPTMARLVFGASTEWEKVGRVKEETVPSPGFGCLDNAVCRKAVKGLADPTWTYFLSSETKNGDFHEMLGRTSDEIDEILFTDASFFRSFIGKSVSYADAVAHWMTEQNTKDTILYNADDIAQMRNDVKLAYKEAFSSYIENVIGGIVLPEGGAQNVYIQTLQSGYVFRGYSSRSLEDKSDTTKLVYSISSSKFLGVKGNVGEKVTKRIEGGLYLYAAKSEIKPKTSSDVFAKIASDMAITPDKIRAAYADIVQSAYCPYGYVARSVQKILAFAGSHVDFFPTTRVNGLIGDKISLYKPNNCIVSQISLQSSLGHSEYLTATPIRFFVNDADEKSRRMNKHHLSMLRYLKDIWTAYIFTRSYIRSLLVMKDPSPMRKDGTPDKEKAEDNKAVNAERLFARGLARRLRINKAIITLAEEEGLKTVTEELVRQKKHREVIKQFVTESSKTAPELVEERDELCFNIYDLLPYYEKKEREYDETMAAMGVRESEYRFKEKSQREERIAILSRKYPNVFRNFYTNCDTVFKKDRLELLWQEHIVTDSKAPEDNPLAPFTNLDYVNGFLLAENFIIRPQREKKDYIPPSYMPRDQYMAMSASVLYANRGINEEVDFMDGQADEDEDATFKEKRIVADYDVAQLFANDQITKNVFANIADVPVYNLDPSDSLGTEGDVFFSTLNEALSVNSSFIYLLARSLHVKPELYVKEDASFKFDFIHGREMPVAAAVNRDLNEHTATQPTTNSQASAAKSSWADPVSQGAETASRISYAEKMRQEGQDMATSTTYSLSTEDIVTRVRNQIVGAVYIPKGRRSALLLEEAARNRTSLLDFAPTSRKIANEKSLKETVMSAELQVPRVITVEGRRSNNLSVAEYADEDLQEYLRLIGA